MPIQKLALMLCVTILAAAVTIWVGYWAAGFLNLGPNAWAVALPLGMAAYLAWKLYGSRSS